MGLVGAKFESQVSVRLEVDLMRRIEGLISSRALGPWCEKPSEAIRVVLNEVFALIDAGSLTLDSKGLQLNSKNGLSRMNAKKPEGGTHEVK